MLLLAFMAAGVIAVGLGVKYDTPYVFVPGIVAAVGSFLAFTGSSRR